MSQFPDIRPRDRSTLAQLFRHFGEIEAPRLDSAVYAALSLGVADDADLLDLAALTLPDQPPPNVLYAGVQSLLLLDEERGAARDVLARWFPAIGGGVIPAASPVPAFRNFCLANRERLVPILRSGRTQTSVVHRCAAILPAFAVLPQLEARKGRVALLEIGPSAGLNLRLDCYRYDYGGGHVWGAADAGLVLEVEDRGDTRPPLPALLDVVARRGLELHPLDTSDPATVRWLRALIWPEHVERARLMDAALANAATVPVQIDEGDAVKDLEASLMQLPLDAAHVVFATHMLYQIPPEGRRVVHDSIARASARHPVDWIVMESSGEGDSRIEHYAFAGGERTEHRTLARSDSHGRWLAWGRR